MTAGGGAIEIQIRPARETELDLLEEAFSPNSNAKYHHRRFALQQRGDGIYLIAWRDDEPVGHFLLLWNGPTDEPTGRYPRDTACLEAGATKPVYQRQGIGTRMIRDAERIARARGCRRIGLAVGSTDNPLARRLYERLGYRAWDGGEFTIQWDYETKDGTRGIETEVCVYMFKAL